MHPVPLLLYLAAAAIVLLIPGGALLAWLSPYPGGRSHLSGPVNALVDAAALSISVAALVGLAENLLGLRFSGTAVVVFYGLMAALLAAGLFVRASSRQHGFVGIIFALLLTGILFAWRLYQARELALPPWVDSVHHTLVTRVILENGGVPSTLEPYLPVPLVFHYGFQLITALFAFWSGSPPAQAVLWFGQLLNALVGLAVFRAAAVFLPAENHLDSAGQPPKGNIPGAAYPITAALLVGFAFQMPAYYLTWGRFTLLAGLLLLGPLVAAAMDAWDQPRRAGAWLRLMLLIAGLSLTHIFALLMAAFFLGLLGMAALVRAAQKHGGWPFLWRLAVFAMLGLLLAAPWIAFTLSAGSHQVGSLINVETDLSDAGQQKALEYMKYLLYLLGPRRSHILLGFSGMGLLFALLQPRRRFLAGWAVLLALFALPWGTRSSPFRADYFAIVLFFPAALLLAALLVDAAAALGRLTRRWVGSAALLVTVIVLVGWGIWETRGVINPVTVIATPADAQALAWVGQNIPPDARFFINSTLWLTGTYRGIDGGYWLLPYTGRASLVPPAFYDLGSAEYVARINDWAKRSAEIKGCTPQFWQIVREAELSHVYLREGVGALQPENLTDCPRLREVYAEQGVHIYAILRP